MSGTGRERAIRALRALIRHQHVANAGVTLGQVRSGEVPPYRLDPRVIAYIREERTAVLDALRAEIEGSSAGRLGVLSTFVSEAESYINQNNQFIWLSADDRCRLESVYADYMRDLVVALTRARTHELEPSIQSVQRRHFRRLRRFVGYLAERGVSGDSHLVELRVTCGEYSPSLQLATLGIANEELIEPILDVGCGTSAALVRYLRERGLGARGLDRLAEPSEHIERADWLLYDPGRARWGTVVSHLGFANHFLFQHLYAFGHPEAYAIAYARFLGSLKVGGSLIYTPSLPFVERLLPVDRFAVARSRTEPSPTSFGAPALGKEWRECVGYATRVTRLR